MELLEERGDRSVLVTDLAENAGVSERTLRTAFNEHFATSPARYLWTRRLHAINRALRAADPAEQSVTGLLVRHGEWQFGRFAMRYRRLFGELPSETLKKRRS
jgi:AraC family ethanolamine operon transcriptional activator